MKKSDQEIIDWLVDNTPLVNQICENVVSRRIDGHVLFHEESLDQYENEVKKEVADEAAKKLGCTIEDFYSIIDNEDIWKRFLSMI